MTFLFEFGYFVIFTTEKTDPKTNQTERYREKDATQNRQFCF